jgi:hypothetical protein
MLAWYAKVSPDGHRLFAGRHYRDIQLEHDVLTVVARRRGPAVLSAPLDTLELVRVRSGLLLQVLARDAERTTHVFEFRPRHHADGRALADALR